MPGNFFEDFAPFMQSQDAPQAQAPGLSDNVMQMLDNSGPLMSSASPADVARLVGADQAPGTTGGGSGRRSLLDIIGRASDVLAKVGGADPLYQSTLDANTARQNAVEDRTRQIDLDALKKTLTEQAVTAGQNSLDDSGRMDIARALAGVSSENDPAGAWPVIAKQAGIPDDKAAAIGNILKQNPNSAMTLATSLGYQPAQASKEVQNYRLIAAHDPEAANAYLKYLANPNQLSPYEQLTLANANRDFGLKLYEFQNPQPTAAERTQGIKDAKSVADTKAASAGVMTMLDNIQNGFNNLRDLNALPGQGSDPAENAMGWMGRTKVGQEVGEQMGTPAAQKRLEIAKNVSQLQQEMIKSLPASATRSRFEQEIVARGLPDPAKMDYNTASTVIAQLRQKYAQAVQDAETETAQTPQGLPSKTIMPKLPRGNGASSAGWGKAKVVG